MGETGRVSRRFALAAGTMAAWTLGARRPGWAADTLKVAASQRDQWDTAMPELGLKKGFFGQEGLNLQIFYTNGTAETQQAVLSGSVDVGIGIGLLGLFAAFSKGAPLRVIASEWTGASDFFWYVKADSPIRSPADLGGRTIGFSTVGSSSNLVLLELLKQANVKAVPTPTGGTAATMTQVLSGQIDAGWSQAPLGLQEVQEGKLRIIASGSDVASVADQTTRVSIATAEVLERKADQLKRFVRAYQRTLDWAYSGDEAIQLFAAQTKIPLALQKTALEKNYPKRAMALDEVRGLDQSVDQAIALKRLSAPLTGAQRRELIQVVHGA